MDFALNYIILVRGHKVHVTVTDRGNVTLGPSGVAAVNSEAFEGSNEQMASVPEPLLAPNEDDSGIAEEMDRTVEKCLPRRTKRQKVVATGSKAGGTRRSRGFLKGLPNMPLDILAEVCKLDPNHQ